MSESKRKTIEVAAVREMANAMLANSDDDRTEGRVGVALLLERVLHDTGNYKGFRYLHYLDESRPNHRTDDETRRYYY